MNTADVKKWIKKYRNSKPFICELKVTEACNMDCIYCYRDEDKRIKADKDNVISFFDELADYYEGPLVCSFHGGEPLLEFRMITEIYQELKNKWYGNRLFFTIQTNGSLLTDENTKYMLENNIGVGVSIDSNDDFRNDLCRRLKSGESAFEKTLKGLNLLQKYKVRYGVTCVVNQKNIMMLPMYVEWCYRNHVEIIGLNFIRTNPNDSILGPLLPSIGQYIDVSKEVIETLIYLNSLDSNRHIYILDIANITNKIINPYFDSYICNSPCGAGERILCLNVNGRIDRCDCIGENTINTIGYYSKGKLRELLNAAKEERFAVNKDDIEECQKCDVKRYCTYGCAAGNIIYYGQKDINHSGFLCEWYKAMIYVIKDLLEKGINPSLLTNKIVGKWEKIYTGREVYKNGRMGKT